MTVLLVEDNHIFAEYITYALEDVNLEVAGTLAAAKSALVAQPVGLVLLDLGLPDSKGLDTLRELASFAVPKVVVTTSYEGAREAAKLGACDYCLKSRPEEMLERIRFNIAKARRVRRPRFDEAVFNQIKACLVPVGMGSKLTLAT